MLEFGGKKEGLEGPFARMGVDVLDKVTAFLVFLLCVCA